MTCSHTILNLRLARAGFEYPVNTRWELLRPLLALSIIGLDLTGRVGCLKGVDFTAQSLYSQLIGDRLSQVLATQAGLKHGLLPACCTLI